MENYTVIDLEMTGLNPKTEVIIEAGAVRVRNHKIVDTLQLFVQPGRQLQPKITELTGITQEMADSGITQSEALRQIMEFTGEDILVGHNIIFDYSFLKQLAVNERIPFERRAVDTLKLARKFLKEPEKKSLDSLCEYYQFARESRHRALDDTKATMELFEFLQGRYLSGNEKEFEPGQLQYRPKRQTPATPAQKRQLKELIEYHSLTCRPEYDLLTRSEASRMTDRILSAHGRIQK